MICTFFYINSVLLFTLRDKRLFCETSRYILLYNLLFAHTVHMVSNLLLYLLFSLWIKLAYYACGVLVLISILTATISPLTLAVMAIERYVAVCFPLRHAAIFTVRSTGVAITLVWAFSFIHILIRVCMLLYLFMNVPLSVHMAKRCSKEIFFFTPIFHDFEEVYASAVFLSVGVAIVASYIGVALATRSASTDNASARKALQTLPLNCTCIPALYRRKQRSDVKV
ncbi:odorant receptor 131-2-like [Pempheris klunzingeri]|uniref:odorant receptor 131-2-like n=1 Tax=Pempheris klunzingeri TaxID=3127111 RepID=UPI00397EDA62